MIRELQVRTETAEAQRDLLIHDIRTPLAAIRAYAQLLQRRTITRIADMAYLVDGLRRIEEAAARVGCLLDELTDLPPVETVDRTAGHRKHIDLVQLVQRVSAECEAAALVRSHVVVLPAVEELMGWWNSAGLERMLANLIDNALKYNRHDGLVLVDVNHIDGQAVISVADHGMGIPAKELPRVFEHGYRGSNVDRFISGSGFGLAGARQIVAEHGGTISLESQLGCGTTATVRLPLEVTTPC